MGLIRLTTPHAELSPIRPYLRTGTFYYSLPAYASLSVVTEANGAARFFPVAFPLPCTLVSLGIEVTSPGSAGAVFRVGHYADSSGAPGALLADHGTIDATATGVRELTGLSYSLPASTLLWACVILQGGPTTAPTVRCSTTSLPLGLATAAAYTPAGMQASGVLGALPASASPAGSPAGAVARLYYKITL